MKAQEITAQTILRKHDHLDSWFVSRYGMNLYRGCFHDCAYCDGRAETYRVEGEFARAIQAKTNALEVLDRELNPATHRKAFSKAFILVGGGINDSYQPAERHYRLSRGALELIHKYGHAALVLSRSIFVREDLELIAAIHKKRRAVLGVSFSTVDPGIARHFESSVASPEQRLETISLFKKAGVPCAMFLLPVLPHISDSSQAIEDALRAAKTAGADYVIFGGMTLSQGRQYDHFMRVLAEYDPSLVPVYRELYDPRAGMSSSSPGRQTKSPGKTETPPPEWPGKHFSEYQGTIDRRFSEAAMKVKIPVRMPRALFQGILDTNEYIATILDHIDYMLRLRGERPGFNAAARGVMAIGENLNNFLDPETILSHLPGVSGRAKKLILEILDTGSCRLYDDLCARFAFM